MVDANPDLTWVAERFAGNYHVIAANDAAIDALAGLDFVHMVSLLPPPDTTFNKTAGELSAVPVLSSDPYSYNGSGINVGVWDSGSIQSDHPEFSGRVTLHEAVGAGDEGISSHATHVGGTIGADGDDPTARGMAPLVNLHSWGFNDDELEMRNEGPGAGVQVSNHSYGSFVGIEFIPGQGWFDYGDTLFGQYSADAAEWDDIVVDMGWLLIKSAGNDRNDYFSEDFFDGPYDCIPHKGVAKNILTVGAVNDDTTMSSFSSWGPADDGRIKPDVVANGVGLRSTYPTSSYDSLSGTSMSSPTVTGIAALLIEAYTDLTGNAITPDLLKALLIHGTEDLGPVGPDYQNGYGLVNAQRSLEHIERDDYVAGDSVADGDLDSFTFYFDAGFQASPLRATLVWTDPAASSLANPALVNNLDLRVVGPGITTHYPWSLDGANATNLATRSGPNTTDNVEVVDIDSPTSGFYTAIVEGTSVPMGPQSYALVITGGNDNNRVVTIRNDGAADLVVSSITPQTAAAWLALEPAPPYTIPPFGELQATIAINWPQAPASSTTVPFDISSNDPANGTLTAAFTVLYTGSGPQPPTNLTAVVNASLNVELGWSDNASNEDGYKIERRLSGSTWSEIADVAANTTAWTDTTVASGESYDYRVRAYQNN